MRDLLGDEVVTFLILEELVHLDDVRVILLTKKSVIQIDAKDGKDLEGHLINHS